MPQRWQRDWHERWRKTKQTKLEWKLRFICTANRPTDRPASEDFTANTEQPAGLFWNFCWWIAEEAYIHPERATFDARAPGESERFEWWLRHAENRKPLKAPIHTESGAWLHASLKKINQSINPSIGRSIYLLSSWTSGELFIHVCWTSISKWPFMGSWRASTFTKCSWRKCGSVEWSPTVRLEQEVDHFEVSFRVPTQMSSQRRFYRST